MKIKNITTNLAHFKKTTYRQKVWTVDLWCSQQVVSSLHSSKRYNTTMLFLVKVPTLVWYSALIHDWTIWLAVSDTIVQSAFWTKKSALCFFQLYSCFIRNRLIQFSNIIDKLQRTSSNHVTNPSRSRKPSSCSSSNVEWSNDPRAASRKTTRAVRIIAPTYWKCDYLVHRAHHSMG